MVPGNFLSVLSHGLFTGGSTGSSAATPTLELCDDLVDELITAWGPVSPDSVTRAYWSRIADVEDTALALTSGRKVTIAPSLPQAYSYEPANRGEDLYTHRVSVLVEKRYTDAAGDPTTAWIDAQIDWVYTYIVQGFDWDFRDGSIPTFNRNIVTVSAEVQLFEHDLIRHDKLFSSQVDITFQELVDV